MKQYYIYLNEQEGPFTIEELRSKNISSQTPVWYDGLNNWTTVGEIPELRSLVKATPPPFIKVAPPPFQTSIRNEYQPQSDYEYEMEMAEYFPEKKKLSWGMISLIAVFIISFVLLMVVMNNK